MRASSAAVCLAVLASSNAMGAEHMTPAEVQSRIQRDGARATLEAVYRDPASWRALLAAVASGRADWLMVANVLHATSDAGASEQLSLAVGEALANHPQQVLSASASEFGLAAICSGPDVDDARFSSYHTAMAAIAARQQAVRAVTDESLRSARDSCIAALERSKAGIARFFGVMK